MNDKQLYDQIGYGYRQFRKPDHRIAGALLKALGDSPEVLNVGAGAGSYEPTDRKVVAVEPSRTMIRQRSLGTAPVVQANAARLPFRSATFNAVMAVLTIHHWQDQERGLQELKRIAQERIVILTYDPDSPGFWLMQDYFPEFIEMDRECMPTLTDLRAVLGNIAVRPLPIPADCSDGFLGAYWRRPECYLDANLRSAISTFAKSRNLEPGLQRLRDDLADGSWHARHGELLTQSELDIGYRIVTVQS